MRTRRVEEWELIKNRAVREFYDKLVKDIADDYNFVSTEHLEKADSEGRTSFHFVVAKSYRAISRIPELVDLMLDHYRVSSSRFAIKATEEEPTKKATEVKVQTNSEEESEAVSNESGLVENEEDEQSNLNRMLSLGVTPLDIAVALRDHGMVLKMLESPAMNNPSKYNSNQIAIKRASLALKLDSSETSKLLSFILGREVSDYSRDEDPDVKNEIKNSLSSKLIELFPLRDKDIIIKDTDSVISDLSDDSGTEELNSAELKLPSLESLRVVEQKKQPERRATPVRPRSASILPRHNNIKTTGQISGTRNVSGATQLVTGEEVKKEREPTRSSSAARRRHEDGKKKPPVMRF